MDHLKVFTLTILLFLITFNAIQCQHFDRPERPESFKDSTEVKDYLQKLHTYLATKTGR